MNKFDYYRNIFGYNVFLSFVRLNITSRSNYRFILYSTNFRRYFLRPFDIDTFPLYSYSGVKSTLSYVKTRL